MTSVAARSGARHVFWTGGEAMRTVAAEWAVAHGAATLAMTVSGARLAAITPDLNWITQAWPLWVRASAEFAAGAAGEVHVFRGDAGASPTSIWRTVEYPALQGNPRVGRIILHDRCASHV